MQDKKDRYRSKTVNDNYLTIYLGSEVAILQVYPMKSQPGPPGPGALFHSQCASRIYYVRLSVNGAKVALHHTLSSNVAVIKEHLRSLGLLSIRQILVLIEQERVIGTENGSYHPPPRGSSDISYRIKELISEAKRRKGED